MSALIVSSFPPTPCGIGSYAEQQAAALRREGRAVDVFAFGEGDGDFRGDLRGGFKILTLAKRLWAYDEAILHFTPSFFYADESGWNRTCTALGFFLLALLFGRRMTFVIHETDYRTDAPGKGRSLRKGFERWTWLLSRAVEFHSAHERDAFAHHYSISPGSPKLRLVEHARYFIPYAVATQAQARARLGLEPGKAVFLCIGFVQPHKGFDRAVRAMEKVPSPDARLYIVGSVRIDWGPALDYARELHAACARDPRCKFVETFVDNESFDLWIAAADCVVIPYHYIWSSSIAGRARLHKRPMIVSRAGGLPEQMTEGSASFATDEELAEILARSVGAVGG